MSFGEILLIAVVALVVLGPERLPAVARTLGALVARAQRFVMSVKADIREQTDMAGLATLRQDMQETAYALKAQLAAELDEVNHSVREIDAELASIPADVANAGSPASPTIEPAVAEPELASPTIEPTGEQPEAGAATIVPEAVVADVAPAPAAPAVDDNQLDLFADPIPVPSSRDRL